MRKLLLLLGGARYPFQPKLALDPFPTTHAAFKAAMTGGIEPIVAPADCLDLFDADDAWPEQQRKIAGWLAANREKASRPEALLIYYVGHGGVAKGGDQVHLTINSTNAVDPYFSSIPRDSLATLLRASAGDYRKFLVLDCCFAAAMVKMMQAPIADKMTVELREIGRAVRKPNAGGLAALCASSSIAAARADGHGGLTQFTDALLRVLEAGDPGSATDLSFESVRALIGDELDARYGIDAVAPSSHFPDDYSEPVHRLPLFPNRARSSAAGACSVRPLTPTHSVPRRVRLVAMQDISSDLKRCTINALHYFPADYPSGDCPLGDGGQLILHDLRQGRANVPSSPKAG